MPGQQFSLTHGVVYSDKNESQDYEKATDMLFSNGGGSVQVTV